MPDSVLMANKGLHSRPWRGRPFVVLMATNFSFAITTSANADISSAPTGLKEMYALFATDWHEIALLTLMVALICFSILITAIFRRTRKITKRYASTTRDELELLHAQIDRLKILLLSEPQVLISWTAGERTDILGDISSITSVVSVEEILAFDTWLEPADAQVIKEAVENLRGQGRSFEAEITTKSGSSIGADGRIIGDSAILRLHNISGTKRKLSDAITRYNQTKNELETIKGLLDTLPSPVWARDACGRLVFVNSAYVSAVDAQDAKDVVARELELLDRASRSKLAEARSNGKLFSGRLTAIAASKRRVFDVLDGPSGVGTAGIAIDRTEVENIRCELARMVGAHRRVLDQLTTGVAVFNGDRKLIFYNTAFRSLFDLNPEFLSQTPNDNTLLELLRSSGKLPEQQDFRQWKQHLHETYRTIEAQEHTWHLPDGRTLRVITTPNPEGGVTYLYDDVTEKLDMHRRYDALIKVQRETLDHLAEAVAVFGSDGCVRLHNPAFQHMWKLSAEALDQNPHVDAITAWCHALHDDTRVWRNMRRAVTAIDGREPTSTRIERRDGPVIDLATIPLPDGATLVTLQDVTDSVHVERALRERNEALETADSIKIEFVHHVSYELRSPLTNIIGFANLLSDPIFGPLTGKQREYVGYITSSTNALLAIINNILDLATIDAGAMTLNPTSVDIQASMEAAAEGVRDRLIKNNITLDIHTSPMIGSIIADERRLRQILFNLLSNAIGFSPRGETVTMTAERVPGAIVFSVADHGPGIPPEAMDKIFNWFETDPQKSEHRGPGLGLSLVHSFVELHGGKVSVDSAPGRGTMVTCTFPTARESTQNAA
jgi:signal transduction histidine kinase